MAFIGFTSNVFSQDADSLKQMNTNMETNADDLQWILDELIVKWNHNKEYCIEMIEAMPEDAFEFIPADDMMSFRKQAAHIVTTLHWQMKNLEFDSLPEFDDSNKETLIASYTELFDYLISELEAMDASELKNTVDVFYGESSKRRLLNLMDNHIAHHRGQMIVYLRMKGITPPKYRGW